MVVTSHLAHSEQYICRAYVPDDYHPNSLLTEQTVQVAAPFIAELTSRQLHTDGLLLLDTHMRFRAPATDFFTVAGECVLLDFFLLGQAQENMPASPPAQPLLGSSHNLEYAHDLRGAFEMPADQAINYFCAILSKAYYFRLLDEQCELHQPFAAAVARTQPARLAAERLPVTAEMHQLIHRIRHETRQGLLGRLLLEARLRELLLLQLAQGQQPAPSRRAADWQQLDACRRLLEERYANPPSLQELTRLLGCSESKLNAGFRQQFGTTIRAYLINFRLHKAHQLLLDTSHSVGEVADLVGYKQAAHFTAAFKEKFGVLPSAVPSKYL